MIIEKVEKKNDDEDQDEADDDVWAAGQQWFIQSVFRP